MGSKKFNIFYVGDQAGQAARMEYAGYLFYRGSDTEVSKEAHQALKKLPGFVSGKEPPAETADDKE